MIGIVDVGGGLRGVYSSGIYDSFMDKNFKADYCLGVSAGAANLITYIAGQRGRTLEFYREYPQRKEYMSMENMLRTGSYIGLDYLFSTLSNENGENPLDYHSFKKSQTILRVAATRARDGKAHFFTNEDVQLNDYSILKASCCLPVVCKPVVVGDESYYDGGLAEPIPIKKAFDDGCDKVILVLTKSRQEYMIPMNHLGLMKALLPHNKEIISLAANLHERCAEIFAQVEELEKQGKVIVLEPSDCFGMKTLTKDREPIEKLYESGYQDGLKLLEKMGEYTV